MSRRLLLARGDNSTVIPGPLPPDGGEDGGWTPPPYDPGNVPAVPTAAPWHRATPCDIPTYDGYNQTLHPSVVDFGGKWNGYRWWMMHTPYPVGTGLSDGAPDTHENPSLAASNDCVTWTPIGTQPLVPRPNPDTGHFNSDNELVWNPDDARLELWYRSNYPAENLWHMHSPDTLAWSSRVSQSAPPGPTKIGLFAPCVVRYSATEWRMWDRYDTDTGNQGFLRRSIATSPEGPWSTPVNCTSLAGGPTMGSLNVWHAGITRNATTDTLYAAAHCYNGNNIYGAVSTDGGLAWKWSNSPILSAAPGTWTEQGLYRPSLVLHENGTHVRVWYSGRSASLGWRTGYAELPLTLWP